MANNKAIVIDSYSRTFFSNNGYAFITKDEDLNSYFNHINKRQRSLIPSNTTSGDKEFKSLCNSYYYRQIPHTINVYDNYIQNIDLPSIKFNIVNDQTIYPNDISYNNKVYVYRLQPTNINYMPVNAIVFGEPVETQKISLGGATVNINSKFEVIIPEFSTYGDMDLTVQKNCFIELKLPDNVIDVLRLPDELIYELGYIKGTFTKSGIYSIIIEYADGNQKINIMVPYYKRLL